MGLLDFFKRKYDLIKITSQKLKINHFLKNSYRVENDKLLKNGFKEVQEYGETYLKKEQEIGNITETIVFKNEVLQSYFFKKDGKVNGWYCSLHIRDVDFSYGVNGIVYGLTEGLFINNKEEGEWKDCLFYLGKKYKVENIRNYKNGELDGELKIWYPIGQIMISSKYNKGEIEAFVKYFANGQVMFISQFIDGKRNGKSLKYFENGQIRSESLYYNDEPIGISKISPLRKSSDRKA